MLNAYNVRLPLQRGASLMLWALENKLSSLDSKPGLDQCSVGHLLVTYYWSRNKLQNHASNTGVLSNESTLTELYSHPMPQSKIHFHLHLITVLNSFAKQNKKSQLLWICLLTNDNVVLCITIKNQWSPWLNHHFCAKCLSNTALQFFFQNMKSQKVSLHFQECSIGWVTCRRFYKPLKCSQNMAYLSLLQTHCPQAKVPFPLEHLLLFASCHGEQ